MKSDSSSYKQPWFHSSSLDLLGVIGFPFYFLPFAFFINTQQWSISFLYLLVGAIGFIDFGHIFAMWFRIKSNPLEKSYSLPMYLVFYFLIWVFFASIIFIGHQFHLERFLVYFVIFHFIKQQYGLIQIYSRTDGPKTKVNNLINRYFIYLTMAYPIFWWHGEKKFQGLYWKKFFFDIPYIDVINNFLLVLLVLGFTYYLWSEINIYKRNKFLNIPKTLSIVGAFLGWNVPIIFLKSPVLYFFTIVYTHNMAYFFIVWIIGNRDYKLKGKEAPKSLMKRFLTWETKEGFISFFFFCNILAAVVLGIFFQLTMGKVNSIFSIDISLGWLPQFKDTETFLFALAASIYYTTQGSHYLFDGFLWKKEKDFAWHLRQEKLKAQPQT